MSAPAAVAAETLLLVDGDAVGRTLIAEYLRDCGYEVLEAADADEALAALARHRIDIVVSEVELGAGNGFSLAAWVRANRPEARMILTASVARTADTAADLCDEGPLPRPYHPQQLLERILRLRSS